MKKILREEIYKIIEYEADDSPQCLIASEVIYCLNHNLPLNSSVIAKKAFTSRPTVTRFAQSLGFLGFKEFAREAVNQDRLYYHTFEIKSFRTSFNDYQSLITYFLREFEPEVETFEKIVTELSTNRRVFIFASYENVSIALRFANQLTILGKEVFYVTSEQMLLINSIKKDDLLIFLVSGYDNHNLLAIWNKFVLLNKTVLVSTTFWISIFENSTYKINFQIPKNNFLKEQSKQILFIYILDQFYNLLAYSNKKYLEKLDQNKFWLLL